MSEAGSRSTECVGGSSGNRRRSGGMRKINAAVSVAGLALPVGALLLGALSIGETVRAQTATVGGQTAAVLQTTGGPVEGQTAGAAAGGQSGATVALTLKSAIEMALRNSKDIQVAKLQASLAAHA